MSDDPHDLANRAADLRAAFDRSFAVAPPSNAAIQEDLLIVRVGRDRVAVRVAAISGLIADKLVTPVPSPVAELLGVASFRGAVVPVYDLRLLLGHEGGEPPRWLLLAGGGKVALGFDALEDHLRVEPHALSDVSHEPVRRGVAGAVRTVDGTVPLLDVPATLDLIERRVAAVVTRNNGEQ